MNLFEKLGTVAAQQSKGGEFPLWLLADILEIAGAPDRYADKVGLVEILVTQIGDYHPFAGAGCFGTSVGIGTIQATIHQIRHHGHSNGENRCELFACCQFFNDNMKDLPKAAEYIKNKLCLNDYESCNRFRIYKESVGEKIPPYNDPADIDEVKKIMQCLERSSSSKGSQLSSCDQPISLDKKPN